MFFNGILALSLRTMLVWENRKLDKKYGTVEEQKQRIATAEEASGKVEAVSAVENYGPLYRYVL